MSDEDAVAGTTRRPGGTGAGDGADGAGSPDGSAGAAGSATTEVEWQFDALDLRPVERWLAALPSRFYADVPTLTVLAKPTRRLVDRYMDTSDWRVGQAGFVLRTRQRGRAVEVTLKETRPAEPGGLRRRLELTESLPSGLSALGPSGPVGRRVRAVAGRRPLVQVLEVRTRRQPFSLRAAGAEVAEVALDDTTIVVGPHQAPARLRRVEVEVAPGWLDTLAPVVQDLRDSAGMSPAALSKFEAGLLAAGLSIPGPPDVGPTEIPPDATMGDVAYAVIRQQVRELISHEPGTRLGEDPEELHDMRVATRRLRAALDVFSSALPSRAVAVREELRWIAAELGAVRDLDVQLVDMEEMGRWSEEWAGGGRGAALVHLRTLLEIEREEARRGLLDALDSPRWERLAAGLVALARQGPSRRVPGARVPAAIAAPPLLDERHRAMRAAARRAHRSQAAHDFHRVRIRGKRLRYTLEFTSALYGQPAVRFAKTLTRLQDMLGCMQDAEVASLRLLTLATEPPPGVLLPPATVFVMGGIAEHYRQESARLRELAGKRLKVLHGRTWRELEAAVDRARRHAEALATSPPYLRPARVAAGAAGRTNGNPPAPGSPASRDRDRPRSVRPDLTSDGRSDKIPEGAPAGASSDAPTVTPEGAPAGASSDAPTGTPEGAPAGASPDAPTGTPEGAPAGASPDAPTGTPEGAPAGASPDAPTGTPTNGPTDAPAELGSPPPIEPLVTGAAATSIGLASPG
jgi:triphosphatase